MSDLDDIDIEEQQIVRRRKSRSPASNLGPINEDDGNQQSKVRKKITRRRRSRGLAEAAASNPERINEDDRNQQSKGLKERVSIECPEDSDVDDHEGSSKPLRAGAALHKRFRDWSLATMHAVHLHCSYHALVMFAFQLMRDKNRQRAMTAFNEHCAAVQIQRICRGSSISS